jgi:uncharacterized Fe-S center protein
VGAQVFFIDNRAGAGRSNLDRLGRLLAKAGLASVVAKGDLVAIKLSFGEKGNLGYIHPVYVRRVVEAVKKLGGRPVLMDSNTLYKGSRSNAHDSLVTALENGFSYATVGAPLLILDGLDSHDYRDVPVPGTLYQTVKIGSGIADAAALISLAHVKGHLASGLGAQIKNLSMGAAPRSGKQMMHSDVHPEVQGDVCIACGRCIKWCPQAAISLESPAAGAASEGAGASSDGAGRLGSAVRRTASIDPGLCIGCGECVANCPSGAIGISWESETGLVQRKMAEFALGALAGKRGKFLGVSFALNVTPDCDCFPWSDAALVPDVGILAGTDPVALDQAAYDLVNAQEGLPGTALGRRGRSAKDKFAAVHKGIDPTVQLAHGEAIGLGTRDYDLVR